MALAVVTGAGSGIGAAIARHAAKAGYDVAVWDLDADAASQVASGIGGNAIAGHVNIASAESVTQAFEALPEAPALLVNNAGIVRFGPLLELSEPDWRAVLDVNLTGTFLTSREAAARMIAAGGGAIVNISSVNGVSAAPNAGAYTSTKGAINTLTEQMALEWGPLGVRVNAACPNRSTPTRRCAASGRAAFRWAPSVRPRTSRAPSCSWPRIPPAMSTVRCSSWTAASPSPQCSDWHGHSRWTRWASRRIPESNPPTINRR